MRPGLDRPAEAGDGGSAAAGGLAAELRSRGYRLTPQRQLVLAAVTALGHATPDAVAARVRETASGVNISTVYRTLELLEELGLVTHTHLAHGAPTYHSADDDDHVHLVCRVCGRVTQAGTDLVADVVDRLAVREDFDADVRHLAIFGRCSTCRSDQRSGSAIAARTASAARKVTEGS